ncbi:FtsX-like permease family protein [Chitinophaga sp. Mgbs1]|uniref:FtsX-like permease family protein n=1 Tax=Chitinophaga solisilvae TaxID=1233460 RepID=A0A433WM60_9BACT|nr:FtsX-like permease family protein [Chitinophaga solisilvae]
MIKLYFKLAYKNLQKNRMHALISIFGLSLGLCCGIVLYQFIRYHSSFDSYHKHASEIYRVVTDLHLQDGSVEYDPGTPLQMVDQLRENSPAIVNQVVLMSKNSLTVSDQTGGKARMFAEDQNVAFTDARWFSMFDYTWLQGDKNTAMDAPNAVVLTRSQAKKYFGSVNDAIGKDLMFNSKYLATVKGVVEDYPSNTDYKVDIFVAMPAYKSLYPDRDSTLRSGWGMMSSANWTFVQLRPDASPATVDRLLKELAKSNLGELAANYSFHLEPMKDLHYDLRYGGVIQRSMLTTLFLIGFFIVLIACVNYVNLSVAQVTKRAREIGTMKVFGSRPADIFRQFMVETSTLTLIATLLAVLWALLIVPFLNKWLSTELSLFDITLLPAIIILVLVVIFISGAYPSMILSRFTPLSAIKDKAASKSPGKNLGLKFLVIFQNSVAQILIICTIVVTLQVKFLKNTNVGFNKEGVVLIPVPDGAGDTRSYLRNQLSGVPGLKGISFCFRPPSDEIVRGGSIKYDMRPWEDFSVRSSYGDASYIRTFGLQLIAGRNLSESDSTGEAVVNEELVSKLGIKKKEDIIGHKLVVGDLNERPVSIVGVVRNFQVRPLMYAIEPTLITTHKESYKYMAVRIDGRDPMSSISAIRNAWESAYPANVFRFQFFDDRLASLYHREEVLNRLINTSAVVAIFISCLGLLGLISITIVHRTKEIGIRKVVGASAFNIASLLITDFFKLIGIAIVLASPVAWILMHKWLSNYANRITMEWYIFLAAACIAVIIAFATIYYQVMKAVRMNTIKSLRQR